MKENVVFAEAYYVAMKAKDISKLSKYLDSEVHFITPFAELRGKNAVLDAVREFMTQFKNLVVRSKLGSGGQTVTIYDVEFPSPFGVVRTAALMDFKEGLITRYELFYDTRPFINK